MIALIAAAAAAILVARGLIERRRGNRRDAFVAQLPEIARMLSNGAAAGLSMQQAVRMASRELADPAGAELKRVIEEIQVGRSVEDALEALRDRLPSREVAVLMTTIAIQQRAGGDTVRALGELAATLEARKDLRREIKTLLSRRRLHVLRRRRHRRRDDPDDQRDLARRDPGHDRLGARPRRPRRRDDPVGDRVRADPADDEGRCLRCRALFGGLTVLCLMVGLAAVPMLRDQGPVERLGGRIGGVREPNARRSVIARLVAALAARLGPRLAPSLRASRRAALEHRLDYAGRPGNLTVQALHRAQGGARAAARARRRRPARCCSARA